MSKAENLKLYEVKYTLFKKEGDWDSTTKLKLEAFASNEDEVKDLVQKHYQSQNGVVKVVCDKISITTPVDKPKIIISSIGF